MALLPPPPSDRTCTLLMYCHHLIFVSCFYVCFEEFSYIIMGQHSTYVVRFLRRGNRTFGRIWIRNIFQKSLPMNLLNWLQWERAEWTPIWHQSLKERSCHTLIRSHIMAAVAVFAATSVRCQLLESRVQTCSVDVDDASPVSILHLAFIFVNLSSFSINWCNHWLIFKVIHAVDVMLILSHFSTEMVSHY